MHAMTAAAPTLRRNDARHRFEIEVDGKVAGFMVYRPHGQALELVHTEVDSGYEGQGLAGQLTRFALDQARAAGQKVIPSCAYVAAYLQRHPQDQDLVAS
jgi:predicted GNAT family acetyltransferase